MLRFLKTFISVFAAAIGGGLFLLVSNLIVGMFIAVGKPVIGLFVLLAWLAFVATVCVHLFVDSDFF